MLCLHNYKVSAGYCFTSIRIMSCGLQMDCSIVFISIVFSLCVIVCRGTQVTWCHDYPRMDGIQVLKIKCGHIYPLSTSKCRSYHLWHRDMSNIYKSLQIRLHQSPQAQSSWWRTSDVSYCTVVNWQHWGCPDCVLSIKRPIIMS